MILPAFKDLKDKFISRTKKRFELATYALPYVLVIIRRQMNEAQR